MALHAGQKLDTGPDLKMSLGLQLARKVEIEDHGDNFLMLNIFLTSKLIVEVNDYFDCLL